MFMLSTLSDVIPIQPKHFNRPTHVTLEDAINAKYANRVLQSIGLCIALHSILSSADGTIKYGDGNSYVQVEFNLIVWRPFRGEVLVGRIKGVGAEGIKVSLGFFEDIFIPASELFEGTEFDATQGGWIWHQEDIDLFLDVDDTIRFRVEDEVFTDKRPMTGRAAEEGAELLEDGIPPYQVIGSCSREGLGNVKWWE
ncbi:hypothetical protein SAICODRAFT_79492 [Saitoella complicata NRRL Y-17804]|nr:uncharacterized protein SAICODRAFT_79492 [Saitoella complicata NRRL Y-17804]ODQ53767.1 hypothetical protein SAICODRAFT_79492 [Saitoella complicata NRRL Y-17804]